MKHRRGTLGVAVGLLLIGAAVDGLRAETITLRMANVISGGPIWQFGAEAFARNIATLSGDRIQVENFQGGMLGDPLRVSTTVRDGGADLGFTWMAYDWGRDRATVLFAGFAGSMEPEPFIHWLYSGGGLELQREFRKDVFGLVSLPMFIIPTEVFLHSRVAVSELSDLEGLKFRTAGAWLDIARGMGAAPVTMASGEIFTALERGVVEAAEWSTPSQNIPMGFHEIAPYVVIPGVHQPVAPWELVINETVWDGLSEQDHALIEIAARLVSFDAWVQTGHDDLHALKMYEEHGNEVIELSREAQQAVKDAAVAWADGEADENAWFERVWESQKAYERLWTEGARYRKLQSELTD